MLLDHIGIAVQSIDETRDFYEKGILLKTEAKIEEVAGEKVRVLKIPCGDPTKIELIEAIEEDSAIAKFIAKRGPGLHHLCYESHDIEADVARLRELGYRSLSDEIGNGADGMRVMFFHPKDTFGVLTEIAQH